jgi:hypothetical protein
LRSLAGRATIGSVPPRVHRRIALEVAGLVAAIAVGAVLMGIDAGAGATTAGLSILGLALVGATAVVFLEVGLSEDRERAAERAAARDRRRARRHRLRPPPRRPE